jgi:uncharacterized protein with PIN domain
MNQAALRFYAELNDFLSEERRSRTITYTFVVSGAVKDAIEALGVPHTEVDLILANGQSVDFSYRVRDGDKISIYPVFESIDISPLERLRPIPLREMRFVLDTHLGKLAAYLRMLGLDAAYCTDYADEKLARISQDDRRILLTRDRGLLKRNIIIRGYFLRATNPREQLIEVLQRFDLFRSISPFERCMHCNALLRPVAKEIIADRLLPETRQHYEEFRICQNCDRVYWKGSHYQRMHKFLEGVLECRQR